MRKGWQKLQLAGLVKIKHGFAFGSEFFAASGPYVLLTPGNFIEEGGFRWMGQKQKFFNGPVDPNYVLDEGDLLIAMTEQAPGLLGSSFFVPESGRYLHNQRLGKAVVARRDLLDKEFLHHWLNRSRVRQEIFSEASGTKVKHTSPDKLRSLEINLPPLPEQRRIAEILRTWDEAIEKLEALLTANIRRRVWLRTHLFTGKVRLPGFKGEWRWVPLSDVLHEHGLNSTGSEEVFSVSVHKGLVNQVEHLGRSFSAANTDNYNRVLPGDIVYTKSPTGDFPLGIIKQSKINSEVIVSPLYGVFTPQTYALGVILDALFESPVAARNYLRPLVQKGAKNTIAVTNRQFLEGKLHLPMEPAEQAAIADIVKTSNAELAAIESEITALQRQKRGLMQKLLTGEWRVSVDQPAKAAQ